MFHGPIKRGARWCSSFIIFTTYTTIPIESFEELNKNTYSFSLGILVQVSIGTHIEIVDVNDFDHSIDVKIDGTLTHISNEVAQNILICVL